MRLIRGLHNLKRLPERSDNPWKTGVSPLSVTLTAFTGVTR